MNNKCVFSSLRTKLTAECSMCPWFFLLFISWLESRLENTTNKVHNGEISMRQLS